MLTQAFTPTQSHQVPIPWPTEVKAINPWQNVRRRHVHAAVDRCLFAICEFGMAASGDDFGAAVFDAPWQIHKFFTDAGSSVPGQSRRVSFEAIRSHLAERLPLVEVNAGEILLASCHAHVEFTRSADGDYRLPDFLVDPLWLSRKGSQR